MSNLTLLSIEFRHLDLPLELEPLKQLSSLHTLHLMLERRDMNRLVREEHLMDIIGILRQLPLGEFDSNLNFGIGALAYLSKACPRLRKLSLARWWDIHKLDTSSPPVFPKLDFLQAAIRPLDRSENRYAVLPNLVHRTQTTNPTPQQQAHQNTGKEDSCCRSRPYPLPVRGHTHLV